MYALQLFADSVDHTATVPAAVARAQLPSDNVTLDLGGILMDLQDNSQLNLAPRQQMQLFADSVDHTATVPAAVARAQLPSDNVTLDHGGILMDLQDNSQLKLAPRLTTAHLHPGSSEPHHCNKCNCFSVLCQPESAVETELDGCNSSVCYFLTGWLHRLTGQLFLGGGLSHLCPKNFLDSAGKNCYANLQNSFPHSPHPVIINNKKAELSQR